MNTHSLRERSGLLLPAIAVLGVPLLLAEAIGAAPRTAQGAGQSFEGFDAPSNEDLTAYRRDERALWGRDSSLSATSHFPGSGGPGGDFDWAIHALPGGGSTVLSTNFSVIQNASQTATQAVLDGVVHVRDLTVEAGAVLDIRGTNQCRIHATGVVRIDGLILARGTNHLGVVTLNTGGPSQGTVGPAGGGRGGTSSLLSTQSTPAGEDGYGPFNAPHGGGRGGESSFHPSADVNLRRGSGGGGGRFGPDVRLSLTGCPDQSRIGLDAERGGPGGPGASGALGGVGVPPVPGAPGVGPFQDGDPTNDFFGRMITQGGATIVGELLAMSAGSGGGAGGDACMTATFPTLPYTPASDEIGSGGGGGGGSLLINALGDVVFGPSGRIDLSGGHGGGGENTNGINRVGGGGGGGSGGHLVIQCGGTIDMRACTSGPLGAAIVALGGQGGEGKDGNGGANPGGVPTLPAVDSINLVPPYDASCIGLGFPYVEWPATGGDGGPGVVQLHVGDVGSILPPTGPLLSAIVQPPPVGAIDPDDPTTWNRLVPGFGPLSSSRSQWSSLGSAGLTYAAFAGTDATGRVVTSGGGSSAGVPPLAPVASGALQIAALLPRIDVDGRTLLLDPASFTDSIWVDAPATLVEGSIEIGSPGALQRFDIGAATVTGGIARLTVADAGTPLAGLPAGTPFAVRPRFFRVATDGRRDSLPDSASIRILFQGAPANGLGQPDTSLASAWTPNAASLASVPGIAFVRFEVRFDLTADGSTLTASSPRPSVEFVRLVWRP